MILGLGIILSLISYSQCIEFTFPLTGNEGKFSSPNYPKNYPLNTSIKWTITAPVGQKIRITFLDFGLEKNKKCIYDYLQIKEVLFGRITQKFCGYNLPPTYETLGNTVEIRFVSDAISAVEKGFQAKWTKFTPGKEVITASPSICPTKTVTVFKYVPCSVHKTNIVDKVECVCPGGMQSPILRTIPIHPSQATGGPGQASTAAPRLKNGNDCNMTSLGHSGGSNDTAQGLVITLACLFTLLLIVNIVLLIILCRRDRGHNLAQTYIKRCLPTKCTQPGSPDIYIPSVRRPTLRMVNGDIVVMANSEQPRDMTLRSEVNSSSQPENHNPLLASTTTIEIGTNRSRTRSNRGSNGNVFFSGSAPDVSVRRQSSQRSSRRSVRARDSLPEIPFHPVQPAVMTASMKSHSEEEETEASLLPLPGPKQPMHSSDDESDYYNSTT